VAKTSYLPGQVSRPLNAWEELLDGDEKLFLFDDHAASSARGSYAFDQFEFASAAQNASVGQASTTPNAPASDEGGWAPPVGDTLYFNAAAPAEQAFAALGSDPADFQIPHSTGFFGDLAQLAAADGTLPAYNSVLFDDLARGATSFESNAANSASPASAASVTLPSDSPGFDQFGRPLPPYNSVLFTQNTAASDTLLFA
jgi:hypothetical protein